jgi:predicted dinucleotide-binding enzyme
MRIGIIGTGNMGRAIGVRFSSLGHDVVFGSREPRAAEAAAGRTGGKARAGTNDDAARHGEVLVWTIRDSDPAVVLRDPSLLEGKVVININNRDYAHDVQSGAWFDEAIAETFQARAPKALVVKALNLVAMEALDTSPDKLRSAGAQLFIAGADNASKQTVARLLSDLGFEAVDVGASGAALRAVEALGDVIRLLMIDGGKGARANLQLRSLPEPDLKEIGGRDPSAYH